MLSDPSPWKIIDCCSLGTVFCILQWRWRRWFVECSVVEEKIGLETSPGKGEYDGEMFSDPSPCETRLLHSLTWFEFHLSWLAYCAASHSVLQSAWCP